MQVFLAGVMQGARRDHLINEQDYRVAITHALQQHVPEAQIFDPWASHPDSVDYDLETARQTFLTCTAMASQADLLIAYLPTASMGTAVEMWTAHQAGVYIIAVTPMEHNWVVLLTADEIVPDLDSLLEKIAGDGLARLPIRREAGAE